MSPEESILAGNTPDGKPAVAVGTVVAETVVPVIEEVNDAVEERIDLTKDANGHPIFADLNQQVAYDWTHLNSSQIKIKKNSNAQYAAALLAYLNAEQSLPIPVVEEPVVAAAVITEPVAVEPPAPANIPVADTDDTGDPNLVKTTKGWEYRVDLGDGSGVQVFRGKTQKEVIQALGKAQINATKKIRQQEQEKKSLLMNEPADIEEAEIVFKPRTPTAEETWEIGNNLSDPAKAAKALDKYLEIRLGGPIDKAIEKISRHDQDLVYRNSKNQALEFIAETPEFFNTSANRTVLADFIEEKGWATTAKNLRKAYLELELNDKFTDKREEQVSTPETEAVSTESSREVATVVAPPAAAATVPNNSPAPSTSSPAGLPTGARMRPGSMSTGMSPRSSSVRTNGSTPATSVGLTAEEYRRIPASETKLKYQRDPVFKAAVDKLITEGKI